MASVTNHPFHVPCLEQCEAIAVKRNDDFDGVDIDNPSEQIEIELQTAVNKLDALRVEVFNEQIRFKELVNKYNTTLRSTTSIGHSSWEAADIIEQSRQISKCHLDFMKKNLI